MNFKALSLFSSAGVGETYLSETGIDVCCANELIQKRANLHKSIYPKCKMICGDITDSKVFTQLMLYSQEKGVNFVLASPPCQGMSVANRFQKELIDDPRNHLITYVFKAIEILHPEAVLIENVPTLLKIKLPYKDSLYDVVSILNEKFGAFYSIDARVVNASDYGVPQNRLRAMIKMYKKQYSWPWPTFVNKKVTVRDAIGHLPTLESGEKSEIKWHFAREHDKRQVLCMKHTPTGCSAFDNSIYFPKKKDGSKVHGFNTTYRRMDWDKPAPTITIRSDAISSQRNVHPGNLLPDGTYSDARVLTPLELMILDSLPDNWNIPDNTPEILIRQIIGESIPPLMMKRIVEQLKWKK